VIPDTTYHIPELGVIRTDFNKLPVREKQTKIVTTEVQKLPDRLKNSGMLAAEYLANSKSNKLLRAKQDPGNRGGRESNALDRAQNRNEVFAFLNTSLTCKEVPETLNADAIEFEFEMS